MARQQFEKGQTVYCHRGGTVYKKAIVTNPDIKKYGFGRIGRKTHYVNVRYINPKGQPEGSEWPITNRANLILTEEAHNEMTRGQTIIDLHRDITAYAKFEDEFARYFEQAKIIYRTLMNTVAVADTDAADIRELAHYLRGMFGFLATYRQLTRDEVRTLRATKLATAAQAMGELAAMGEEAPELAKEAGS